MFWAWLPFWGVKGLDSFFCLPIPTQEVRVPEDSEDIGFGVVLCVAQWVHILEASCIKKFSPPPPSKSGSMANWFGWYSELLHSSSQLPGFSIVAVILWMVSKSSQAAPRKPLVSDDSPLNTNKQWFQPWFQSGAKWILSIHSSKACPHLYNHVRANNQRVLGAAHIFFNHPLLRWAVRLQKSVYTQLRFAKWFWGVSKSETGVGSLEHSLG